METTDVAIFAVRAKLAEALKALEDTGASREQSAWELVAQALFFVGERREWCATEARGASREAADRYGQRLRTKRTSGASACECNHGGACRSSEDKGPEHA